MKIRGFVLAFLVASAILAGAMVRGSAQENKEYIFALWPTMGKQSSKMNDLLKQMVDLMFQKMGEKVRVIEVTREQALQDVMSGKIDFTYLPNENYVEMVNRKKPVHPILTVTPRGHIKDYKCFLVLKTSPYTKVEDLAGKRLPVSDNVGDYIAMRWYLKTKGVDEPMAKYFSQLVPLDDELTGIEYLISGKLDAAYIGLGNYNLQKYTNASLLNKLKQIDCHELPWPNSPVVIVGDPDPKMYKKLYDVMANLDSFPEMKRFKPVLNMTQSQIYLVKDKDYDDTVKIYNQAKKSGWIDEYKKARAGK